MVSPCLKPLDALPWHLELRPFPLLLEPARAYLWAFALAVPSLECVCSSVPGCFYAHSASSPRPEPLQPACTFHATLLMSFLELCPHCHLSPLLSLLSLSIIYFLPSFFSFFLPFFFDTES